MLAVSYQTLKATKLQSLQTGPKQINSFKLLYDFISMHSLSKEKAAGIWQKF